uniref:Uncharacterized protein n=1 Tax=Cacopsylla melanoneura TaxID=428564 RepID=A0A8D8W2W3_9HEMI
MDLDLKSPTFKKTITPRFEPRGRLLNLSSGHLLAIYYRFYLVCLDAARDRLVILSEVKKSAFINSKPVSFEQIFCTKPKQVRLFKCNLRTSRKVSENTCFYVKIVWETRKK